VNRSFSEQLLDRVAQKLNANVNYKCDLYLGDYSPISAESARVLIGYTKPKLPTRTDINNFVAAEFNGDVFPVWDTALAYPDVNAVSVVLTRNQPTLPVEAKDDQSLMTPITAATFMDTKLGDTWEIVDAANGAKCLQRVARATIEELLRSRKQGQMIKAAAVSFADVAQAAPAIELQKGDKVRFFWEGATQTGIVTKVNNKGISFLTDSGTPYPNLPYSAIVEILERGAGAKKEDYATQREFYEKVYCDMDGKPWKEFIDLLLQGVAG